MCMVKKCVCLIPLVFLLCMVDNASALAVKKGPYLIYPGNNTQMTVLWQLDATSSCTIEWGTDTTYSVGIADTNEYGTDHQHKYTIDGLAPGTTYYYRVTPGALTPLTGSFRTAPAADAASLKFLAYGDTRTNPADHNTVCSMINSTIAGDPGYQTLLLLSGDWVSSDSESSWTDQYFNRSYSSALQTQATVPITGCMGNHEDSGTVYVKYWPYPYVAAHYWSFDYGPAHIVVIDQYVSYSTGSAQLTWLANDLANTNKLWKFIVLHAPGWSAAGGHGNTTAVQSYIQPLCEEYDVQIVFGGHNHYYARAVVNGVHHVTTGAGGAPFHTPLSDQLYVVVTVANTLEFCKVNIVGDSLVFQAIKASDGTVIDAFNIDYVPDINAPTPNPMEWSSAPVAISSTTIAMTATTGSDATGPVRYFFQNTTSGMSSHNSGWQTSTSWTDTGLDPCTTYSYQVQARDSVSPTPNVGDWSTTASATTPASDTTAPTPDPMTWSSAPAATGSTTIAMTATTASDVTVPVRYFFQNTTSGMSSHNSGWQTSTSWTDTGLSEGVTYSYQVQARDSEATPNVGGWSTMASATTINQAPTPNPMTWSSAPVATSSTTIVMTATTASDATGPVQYFFQNTTSGMEGHNSGWQTSTSWTDTGLDPCTTYSYQVQARDSAATPNVGGWSTTANATTPAFTLFSDNFDSGVDTLADGTWTRYSSSADWIDLSVYYSSPKSARIKGGSTLPGSWIQRMQNTTGYMNIHVKYARKVSNTPDAFDAGEYFYAEWSTNGTTWNNLETTQDPSWAVKDFVCASGADSNATFRVRFRVNASGATEYAWVDNVEITASPYDTTAPTPNPMTWFLEPEANSLTTIEMTATTATDTSGVEYFFHNTTITGHDSGWQAGTTWTDTNLSPNTLYTYQVKARDQSSSHNETAYSTAASETTWIVGDLNGDGAVDLLDFAKFAAHWLETGCGTPDWCGGTNLDQTNSTVDYADIKVFIDHWLEGL